MKITIEFDMDNEADIRVIQDFITQTVRAANS